MNKPEVSIYKCLSYEPEEVAKAISELLEPLGGMKSFINRGDRVIIKPNLLKASPPEKAVTTHPAVVEAVVREVLKAGGIPSIGDSPGIGNMQRIFQVTGMKGVAERTGAKLIEFSESVDVRTAEGATFKSLEISRDIMESHKVINLAKVKTHAQMHVTLGVKNCFGCIVGKRKPQWHFKAGVSREYFAQLLLDIYSLVNPALNISDGIIGMEGNGPGSGDPRPIGLLFASNDALAMDAVITEVLNLRHEDVPLFLAASQRGLAQTDVGSIDILGPEIKEVKVTDFKGPKIIDMMFGPPFLRRYFKNALTAKPRIDHKLCTLCRHCVRTCPTEVMSVSNGKLNIDYRDCIHCFCCQEVCPEGAITPKQGWLLRLIRKGK